MKKCSLPLSIILLSASLAGCALTSADPSVPPPMIGSNWQCGSWSSQDGASDCHTEKDNRPMSLTPWGQSVGEQNSPINPYVAGYGGVPGAVPYGSGVMYVPPGFGYGYGPGYGPNLNLMFSFGGHRRW